MTDQQSSPQSGELGGQRGRARKSGTERRSSAEKAVADSLTELKNDPRRRSAEKKSVRVSVPKAAIADLVFSAEETPRQTVKTLPSVQLPAVTAPLFREPDMAALAAAAGHGSSAGQDGDEAAVDGESAEKEKEAPRRSRRGTRGGRSSEETKAASVRHSADTAENGDENEIPQDRQPGEKKRLRRRRKTGKDAVPQAGESGAEENEDSAEEVPTVRRRRRRASAPADEVSAPKGSTRLAAKRQRRKEGREVGRRRHSISEAEFLARRESVYREMLIRERDGLNQIAVTEDGVLVEHYVARHTQTSMVGNVYLGRVQNVLPSMEAAFVDIGRGRNAVLYAGEVNWDAVGLEGRPRRIENALKSGDPVLVQVTKDPIGHKGARLTGQITLAGRHLVLVPNGAMTGISRKLPEAERIRLKRLLKEIVPSCHGVIVRTAAEGATDEQLRNDVGRLIASWKDIEAKSKSSKNAPSLLKGEPELAVRVVRDVFNEDFNKLRISGENAWETISRYVEDLSPELADRMEKWEEDKDIFAHYRVDEQLQKAFDRMVYLPSGGSLVIDRTEAMTVIDVNTGKFTGTGGTLEETVTRNNLEAAEEIVRQLRLRDIGGIVVIDFIDMVLEANRDLVLRRLIECLGRDRTRHQVAEVSSLGLVQMTRKRVGQGLVEAFSTTCEACAGRGYISHEDPVEKEEQPKKTRHAEPAADPKQAKVKEALANIAAAAGKHHEENGEPAAQDRPAEEKDGHGENAREKKPKSAARARKRKDAAGTSRAKAAKTAPPAPAPGEETAEKETPGGSAKSAPKRRRVSSTGTITPKTAEGFEIISFPVAQSASQTER